MPDFQSLEPSSFAPSALPYAQGVAAGSLVFVAGQVALTDDGEKAGPDVKEQTQVVLDRVRRVVAEAGGDLTNVVSATVYLTDFANFKAFNEAWVEAFGEHRPARAAVQAGLGAGFLVEISAIAVV